MTINLKKQKHKPQQQQQQTHTKTNKKHGAPDIACLSDSLFE